MQNNHAFSILIKKKKKEKLADFWSQHRSCLSVYNLTTLNQLSQRNIGHTLISTFSV